MTQVFPIFYSALEEKQFDPSQYCQGIGSICSQCLRPLVFRESINPCSCYTFCHEKCALLSINAMNLSGAQTSFKCSQCKHTIQLDWYASFYFELNYRTKNILAFIASGLIASTCLYILLSHQEIVHEIFSIFVIIFVLTFCLTIFSMMAINLTWKRKITFIKIHSKNLDMDISAFRGFTNCSSMHQLKKKPVY